MSRNRAGSRHAFQFGSFCRFCLATGLCVLGAQSGDAGDQPTAQRAAVAGKTQSGEPASGEVAVLFHFSDGRSQRLLIPRKAIAIATPYARLEIPIEDIRTIELSPRLPGDLNKKVQRAIARLESPDEKERSAATAELFNLREKSYLALVRASKSNRKELAKRAGELVEDLRSLVPREIFEASIWDVIETDNSRFAGEIDLSALGPDNVRTIEVELNRADRQVAVWVLANLGIVWAGGREIRNPRLLPKSDFRIERIVLHDQTAQPSVNGFFGRASKRIEFNRDDIDRLASLTALTNLEFSSAGVTDDVVRRLSKLTSLERLILCGTSITDAGLHSLAGMKRLNRLDLSDTAITDEGLRAIAELKSLTNSAFAAEQRKWGEPPHPPDMYLNRTRTTEAGMARLQAALPDCQISASHLFDDQGVPDLVPLPPPAGAPDGNWAGWLLGYRIGNCEVFTSMRPTVGVRRTEDLSRPVQIVKLAFYSPGSPQDWSYPLTRLMLRRLADLPHLRELCLGRLRGDAFECLRGFRHLESVEISSADATDESLRSLAGRNDLTSLSLVRPKLAGSGLISLSGSKRLKRLELVESPRIQRSDLDALATLPALETLNLRGSAIDDTAVESLKKLTTLRSLDLSQTQITPNAAADLVRALPKCKILGSTPSETSPTAKVP